LRTTFEIVTVIAALTCAGAGAAIDLRCRRIPNLLTVPAAGLAILLSLTHGVEQSVTSALLGLALGGLLMLPGYIWGGTGGGDVKLLAAVGAFLGPGLVMRTFLYSAVAGGVLAVGVALSRGRLGATVRGAAHMLVAPVKARQNIEADASRRFAYGPAIAAGTMLAVLGF
jgi:prepilin peptidase CpaA